MMKYKVSIQNNLQEVYIYTIDTAASGREATAKALQVYNFYNGGIKSGITSITCEQVFDF